MVGQPYGSKYRLVGYVGPGFSNAKTDDASADVVEGSSRSKCPTARSSATSPSPDPTAPSSSRAEFGSADVSYLRTPASHQRNREGDRSLSHRTVLFSATFIGGLLLALVATASALGAFNVNYCGQLGDGTPHCTSGPNWQPDGGFSNNDLSVMRAFTGQNSTTNCTTGPGYACPRSVILVNTSGTWPCSTLNDYNSTTSCGFTPFVYSRAYCHSDVVANPDPFAIWGNCWKRRVN